jgi:chemotaxis protein methyltransferase CheR
MAQATELTIPINPPSIQLSDRDYLQVRDLVHELAGISLNDGKRELVVARLSKRIRQLGLKTVGEYLTYVREQQTQDELITMLDALSTNLTSFWRESQHFDFLEQHTLPQLAAQAKKSGTYRMRAWSAGCSSGEEPYSLAMLTLQTLPDATRWDLKILATDLSTRVLAVARAGVYGEERVKTIPPAIRHASIVEERTARGKLFRVAEPVSSIVSFARLNLMESWPMKGPMDFIFCRNVMIYFDKPTQTRLVRRFHELLKPGGTLFIGHSESLTGIDHGFRYVRPTIYEKV